MRRALVLLGLLVAGVVLAGCSRQQPAEETRAAANATFASEPAPRGRIYVTNEISGDLSVINVATERVVSTIPLGKRPRGVRVSPDHSTLYVALSGSPIAPPGVDEESLPPADKKADGIGVVDIKTAKLLRVIPGGSDPEQMAVSLDGRWLFVANEDVAQASVIDASDGTVIATIPVGAEPEGVDIRPDGKVVYVTSEEDSEVFVIDAIEPKLITKFAVGPRPRSTGFLPDSTRAYVGSENGSSVSIVDAMTHTVIGSIPLGGQMVRPMGVIASPDGRRVFVSTGRGKSVITIDPATNKPLGAVEVGERPWGLAISADGQDDLHGQWPVKRRVVRGCRQRNGHGAGQGRRPAMGGGVRSLGKQRPFAIAAGPEVPSDGLHLDRRSQFEGGNDEKGSTPGIGGGCRLRLGVFGPSRGAAGRISTPQQQGRGQQVALPDGPGKELVQGNCAKCHGLNLITNYWGDTRQGWETLFGSMIALPADQKAAVSNYLATHFPVKPAPEGKVIRGPVQVTFKEFAAPTLGSRPHDPLAAADGSIWWSGHFGNRLGRVDPRTGATKEYPLNMGAGPHGLVEDRAGNIWYTGIYGASRRQARSEDRPDHRVQDARPEDALAAHADLRPEGQPLVHPPVGHGRADRSVDRRGEGGRATPTPSAHDLSLRHPDQHEGRAVVRRLPRPPHRQRRSQYDGDQGNHAAERRIAPAPHRAHAGRQGVVHRLHARLSRHV